MRPPCHFGMTKAASPSKQDGPDKDLDKEAGAMKPCGMRAGVSIITQTLSFASGSGMSPANNHLLFLFRHVRPYGLKKLAGALFLEF